MLFGVFKYLNGRMYFSEKEAQAFYRQQSGQEGEAVFRELLTEEFFNQFTIFHNLNLSMKGKEVQIDFLLLRSDVIYHFEIKHFRGDYLIKDERWYRREGGEVENPIYQMQRAKVFLENLFKTSVESRLVFTHESFHLYQSNPHLPIYLRSQLGRLFSEMKQIKQGKSVGVNQLEKIIIKHSIEKSKYQVLPKYTYEGLKKGLLCAECRSGLRFENNTKLFCQNCKVKITLTKVLDVHVAELKLLFPKLKLTKSLLYDWCGEQVKLRTIQRYLSKHYQAIFCGNGSYYISKKR